MADVPRISYQFLDMFMLKYLYQASSLQNHQLILERTHKNHPSSFLQRRPQRSWDQGLVEIKRLGLALVPRLTGYNSSAHHRATEKLGSPKRVGVCCLCRITWSSANSNPWEFSGESTMPRMTKYINRWQLKTSWQFQPIWKILVKLDHFPRDRDEHEKYLKPPPSHFFDIWVSNDLSLALFFFTAARRISPSPWLFAGNLSCRLFRCDEFWLCRGTP